MKLQQLLLFVLCSLLIGITAFAQDSSANLEKKRRKEMMDIMNTKSKLPVKTIGIYLYNGYQTIDAMGPYEVLSQLGGAKVFFIAKEKGFVKNQSGVRIQVDTTMDKVKKLDILLIPGGAVETFMQTQDASVLQWIRAIDSTSIYTASVCTGAWILGATGLLTGKNVTTNWYRAEEMMTKYGAHFKQERWVKDGKYWTSAGVTAGLDMSIAIINELKGEKYAQAVMLNLEYDPAPPVNGGSVKKTPAIVVDLMKEMYDIGLKPLITKYGKN